MNYSGARCARILRECSCFNVECGQVNKKSVYVLFDRDDINLNNYEKSSKNKYLFSSLECSIDEPRGG